ncbi:hypothetical protein [Yersinia phage vB_YenM_P778]
MLVTWYLLIMVNVNSATNQATWEATNEFKSEESCLQYVEANKVYLDVKAWDCSPL